VKIGGKTAAQCQKTIKVDGKALRVRDSYGITIVPGQDDSVIQAAGPGSQ
jgi:uncharacterized protein YxjI